MFNTKLLDRGSERIFKLPALILINEYGMISTTELIDMLRYRFVPQGRDSELAGKRKDDYFSQKVRNLKSHDSLSEYAFCEKNNWEMKNKGIIFINDNLELLEDIKSIMENATFTYYEKILN